MSSIAAKLFPHPWLSLILLVTWLLLQNSLAPGQWLLGGALAVAIPWLVARVWPTPVRLRHLWLLPRYLGWLLWDIVMANLKVAWLILTRPAAKLRPGFICMPLDLQDDHAIAVLAATISLTPGTLSVDVAPDRSQLLIHCLDLHDETAMIATLKQRYEAPLKEIFVPC